MEFIATRVFNLRAIVWKTVGRFLLRSNNVLNLVRSISIGFGRILARIRVLLYIFSLLGLLIGVILLFGVF